MDVHTFRAMNTEISVQISNDFVNPDWKVKVTDLFTRNEAIASRFREDSELSQWNATVTGSPFRASKDLYNLVKEAWNYTVSTDFKFNPLIGTALQKEGYDRSFEQLTKAQKLQIAIGEPSLEHGGVGSEIIPRRDTLILSDDEHILVKQEHADIDLGGIGKGWTVDQVYHLLHHELSVSSGIIDAGGDLFVWSQQEPWIIGIQHPFEESKEVMQLCVRQAAVATSNVLYRSWLHQGQLKHHILDGITKKPVFTDIVQATVLGPSTTSAEVASKVICMLQANEVNGWMEQHFPGYGYIFMTRSGNIKLNRYVRNYIEEMV